MSSTDGASEPADVEPAGSRRSTCRGFVVVDRGGLALAPLGETDLVLVGVDDIVALAGGLEALPDRSVSPAETLPGNGDWVTSVVPSLLRVDRGAVRSWDDHSASYVALDELMLAILERAADGVAVTDLLDDPPRAAAAAGVVAAVDALEVLGLVGVDRVAVASDGPEEVGDLDRSAQAAGPVHAASIEEVLIGEVSAPTAADAPEPSLFEGLPLQPAQAARVVAFRVRVRAPRAVRRASRRAVFASRLAIAKFVAPSWDDPDARPEPAPAVAVGTEPVPDVVFEPVPTDPDDPDPGGVDDDNSLLDESSATVQSWTDHRTPVFGVYHSPEHNANLGLGLIIAYARVADGGALNTVFDLRRASIESEPMLAELRRTGRPAIVLFSDYMWSVEHNLAVSAAVKEVNPDSITIHGGPHSPSYPGDADAFLAAHPYVDVLARGEGEMTIAELLSALGPSPDPAGLDELLSGVAGLSYRRHRQAGFDVVRTPDRPRATEMAVFPSPYLTGEFADIDAGRWRSATVETNRGCPYGCTFCDWGQATMSRIRQFPIDRVFAELEWIASRGISEIFLADANFGIASRDVEIAQRIADLHRQYGAPRQVVCSFAKNTVKYTTEIVRIWVEAGICAEGSVALQTTDPVTLENVARSNIRVEKYDALADEFRRHRLPIVTDLLMGLPGATVESFKADLQRCLDQEVTPRMMETWCSPTAR